MACTEKQGLLRRHIGNILSAVFRGGPSIALSVKEQHIRELITMLLKKDCSPYEPAILESLTNLLVVSSQTLLWASH